MNFTIQDFPLSDAPFLGLVGDLHLDPTRAVFDGLLLLAEQEQITAPEAAFGVIDRFGQKVGGAEFQGMAKGRLFFAAGGDDDRHVGITRNLA